MRGTGGNVRARCGQSALALLLFHLTCCSFWHADPAIPASARLGGNPALDSLQFAVLREVNATRLQHGAPMLLNDPPLTRAAVLYSAELAVRGALEHRSTTPGRETLSDRLHAQGANFTQAGENLARFTEQPAHVAAHAAAAWLNSPTHRHTMLDWKYVRSGVGVTRAGDGSWYVVQVYAAPW